jgi:hypothetical protein
VEFTPDGERAWVAGFADMIEDWRNAILPLLTGYTATP